MSLTDKETVTHHKPIYSLIESILYLTLNLSNICLFYQFSYIYFEIKLSKIKEIEHCNINVPIITACD